MDRIEMEARGRGAREQLDINTAQTPGMNRAAAITNARAGRRTSGPGR